MQCRAPVVCQTAGSATIDFFVSRFVVGSVEGVMGISPGSPFFWQPIQAATIQAAQIREGMRMAGVWGKRGRVQAVNPFRLLGAGLLFILRAWRQRH